MQTQKIYDIHIRAREAHACVVQHTTYTYELFLVCVCDVLAYKRSNNIDREILVFKYVVYT